MFYRERQTILPCPTPPVFFSFFQLHSCSIIGLKLSIKVLVFLNEHLLYHHLTVVCGLKLISAALIHFL